MFSQASVILFRMGVCFWVNGGTSAHLGKHPPLQTPSGKHPKQPLRILLECILVFKYCFMFSGKSEIFSKNLTYTIISHQFLIAKNSIHTRYGTNQTFAIVIVTEVFMMGICEIITVRNISCGKVMFSQASVILSTAGAGGGWSENIGGAGIVYLPYGFNRIFSEISRELKE